MPFITRALLSRAIVTISVAVCVTTIVLTSSIANDDSGNASFWPPPPQQQHGRSRSSISSSSRRNNNNNNHNYYKTTMTLEEITGNPLEGSITTCASPLLPVYDRIVVSPATSSSSASASRGWGGININYTVDDTNTNIPHRKIPRTIHVSMKSRCLTPDLFDNVNRWKAALPYHSFYFHDDAAVDRLLFDMPWVEFPQLKSYMRCVRFQGAMKIDVWRILVIYKFGGIYSDSDMHPTEKFTETSPISPSDSAFFLSDGWNRPSQWFFAMEPGHPIAYYTMIEIFLRLEKLESIERPNVVFVTGPDALKFGYANTLGWKTEVGNGDVFGEGTHRCREIIIGGSNHNCTATKLSKNHKNDFVRQLDMKEMVAWNATLNVTRRQKNEWEHGVKHWMDQKNSKKVEFDGSCLDYLYTLDKMVS